MGVFAVAHVLLNQDRLIAMVVSDGGRCGSRGRPPRSRSRSDAPRQNGTWSQPAWRPSPGRSSPGEACSG